MANNIFVDGLYIIPKNEKIPDFIKLRLSIKPKEFIPFIKEHTNEAGYFNFDLKKAESGKLYFSVNTWKKGDTAEKDDDGFEKSQEDIKLEDIPM